MEAPSSGCCRELITRERDAVHAEVGPFLQRRQCFGVVVRVAADDAADRAQVGDRGGGVGVEQEEVGFLARLRGARVLLAAEEAGRVGGGGLEH
jgi:hypothetical protein